MGAAIEIDHVSKHFKLNHERADSLKERVRQLPEGSTYEEFWALRDVDLARRPGRDASVCSATTARGSRRCSSASPGSCARPRARSVKRGRIAALLELGSGFHGDLTGRENIYMNGSILGSHAREIDRIFDDIVAFSEIEEFIDNQVKHYSSGMTARLGFAVAVNVEPEILLVDEVLVGR